MIVADTPLSAKSGERDKRYRVADPYLRFYLSFLRRGLPLVERGRGDLVLLAIERSWGAWRGRAIEPVIRNALLRIAPDRGFPQVAAVGGWWNRRNTPEIDIVAKNDERRSGIAFVGSIKWHPTRGFGLREYNDFIRDVHHVPGVSDQTALLAVTRTGAADDEVPVRVSARPTSSPPGPAKTNLGLPMCSPPRLRTRPGSAIGRTGSPGRR